MKTGTHFRHDSIIKQRWEGELQKATAPSPQRSINRPKCKDQAFQNLQSPLAGFPPAGWPHHRAGWPAEKKAVPLSDSTLRQNWAARGVSFPAGSLPCFSLSLSSMTHPLRRQEWGQRTKRLKCHLSCTVAAAKWTHKDLFNSYGPVFIELLQVTQQLLRSS